VGDGALFLSAVAPVAPPDALAFSVLENIRPMIETLLSKRRRMLTLA
jgi:hypothetical protein